MELERVRPDEHPGCNDVIHLGAAERVDITIDGVSYPGLVSPGYWASPGTVVGSGIDLIGSIGVSGSTLSSAGTALGNAYGHALGAAGQFFRGRPPGQSFAACVGQNMSQTFTLSPSHPVSTTVASGATGMAGSVLGLLQIGTASGPTTLAELLTYVGGYFAGASIPEAVAAGAVASQAAVGGAAIGLAPLVGSAANCASVGVAP